MSRWRSFAPAVALVLTASGAQAQSPTTPRDPLGQAETFDGFVLTYRFPFNAEHLEDLPHAGTVPSLLDTAHGFLIVDRMDGGGLYPGERGAIGGQGSSSAQTAYRLDGVDITDPLTGGAPMVVPDLGALDAVLVGAASFDADTAGPGPVIDLRLRAPGQEWSGLGQVTLAPEGLQADAPPIDPIARLRSRTDGHVAAGGPLGRTALFAAARGTTTDRFEREDPRVLTATARSLVTTLTAAPRSSHALRATLALSGATHPFPNRVRFAERTGEQDTTGVAGHLTWDGLRAGTTWVLTAGFQRFGVTPDLPTTSGGGIIERLRDGAPLNLAHTGDSTSRRAFVQAAAAPEIGRWLGADHHVRIGAGLSREAATEAHTAAPRFGELVNGIPARVWDIGFAGAESRFALTSANAFISDQMALGNHVTVQAGLRAEFDRAAARDAAQDVQWFTVSPRLAARWQPFMSTNLSFTTGYSWYRHRLPLAWLGVGDPSGMTGTMYRWDDGNGDGAFGASELTAVANLNLCCQANAIDSGLRRPTTGEFRIGTEYVLGRWRFAVTGLDRRERNQLAVVNTGVSDADYTVQVISDPAVDIAGLQGFRPLPIYNRTVASFGRDAYRLVNTPAPTGRYQGVEIAIEREAGDRWFMRFGGTAYRSEGVGASRGYRADENDQGLPGEVFLTPNAVTYNRGRLFYDRAYIIKLLGAYQAPWGLRASVIARYQDGQPFTRVVVAEGLNQGTEPIPTYPRGGQRFTFTGTLDARVEWRLSRDARALGLVLEAFNLANMANEVEEDIATGPAFRTITAVQPPRVIRVGLRVGF
jgi:hypothetical protein